MSLIKTLQLIAKLEAENAKLRDVLVKVEAYLSSEKGPLYSLWENCELGDYEYEDGGQRSWEATLHLVRDLTIPAIRLGCTHELKEVLLYREVFAALAPEAKDMCPRCGSLLGYDSHLEQTGETKQEVVIDNAVCPRCEWQSPPIAALADEREGEK
jgi:hypothetical protein